MRFFFNVHEMNGMVINGMLVLDASSRKYYNESLMQT